MAVASFPRSADDSVMNAAQSTHDNTNEHGRIQPTYVPDAERTEAAPIPPSESQVLAEVNPNTPVSLSLSPFEAKAQRAYERARQHSKRPQDRLRKGATKCKCNASSSVCSYCDRHEGGGAGHNMRLQKNALASLVTYRMAGEAAAETEVDGNAMRLQPENIAASPREQQHEVTLVDLLQNAKVRKPKKAGDFELIPPVRSVVVLDDIAFDLPEEEDEWEHVSSDDSDEPIGKKLPSYAQVASAPRK